MSPRSDLPPNQQRDDFLEALRPIISPESLAAIGAWAEEQLVDGDRAAMGLPKRVSAVEEAWEKSRPRIQALENAMPKNAYRRKVDEGHHHYQSLEGMEDATSVGFGYQLNAIDGLRLTRAAWPNNRRLDISGAGLLGPFEYDHLVDANFAAKVAAGYYTEGQELETFHGHTFKVWSTIQAAIDDWVANTGEQSILVVPGDYSGEDVSIEEHLSDVGSGIHRLSLTTPPNFVCKMGSLTVAGKFVSITPNFSSSHIENFQITGDLNLGSDNDRDVSGVFFSNLLVTGNLVFKSSSTVFTADYLTFDHCRFGGGVDDNSKFVTLSLSRFSFCSWNGRFSLSHSSVSSSHSRVWSTTFNDCFWGDGFQTGSIYGPGSNYGMFTNCFFGGDASNAGAFELTSTYVGASPDIKNLSFVGCTFSYEDHSSEWAFIKLGIAGGLSSWFYNVAISGCTFVVPASVGVGDPPIHILWAPNSAEDDLIRVAFVGNSFVRHLTGGRIEDLTTSSRSYSVKGYFHRSVFGPNCPSDFEVELLGGTKNLYVGTGTVIGPGITASPGPDSDYFNGTFVETLDADISEAGGVVTLSLQQEGTGDLTMRFSDGLSILDCTPAATIALTVGADNAPQANYIYILKSTKVLTKSTTQWPATEHIKVGYYLVPSAAFVAAGGGARCYIQQQWNDHRMGTDSQGHMSHMAERERLTAARYFSGINPNGTTSYLTIAGATVDYRATSGVVYQMHPHASPAVDTSGGDVMLVVNWPGVEGAFHNITNLYDIVEDSGGNTIGNNKWFNIVVWGVANKSGTYEPAMINLPSGFYNTQASAEQDISGFDNFDLPREFDLDSSTGFLICRLTVQKQAGTWAFGSVVDLRRGDLLGARGGASSPETEFPDNTFNIFDATDNTKVFDFQADQITPGNTRTLTVPDASGIIALRHEMLDGVVHTDSVADGVTAGSIIIGNDTPKWDELVISVPAATIRNMLSIENGETVPSWMADSIYMLLDGSRELTGDWEPGNLRIIGNYLHTEKVLSFTIGDAAFGLLLQGGDPVIVFDTAGAEVDYLQYVRGTNRFGFMKNAGEVFAVDPSGIYLPTDLFLQFRDAGLKILSSADGQLDIDADVKLELTAPTISLVGAAAVEASESMADNHVVTVNDADAAEDDYLRFSATGGVVGRDAGEVVGDLSLDVPKRSIQIRARSWEPNTTDPAADAVQTETGNGKNYITRAFAVGEQASIEMALPKNYSGGTVTWWYYWISPTGCTAGDTVIFGLRGSSTQDGDAIDEALGNQVTIEDTVLTGAGYSHESPESAALTISGSPSGGDMVDWELERTGGDMSEEAALRLVYIRYPTDTYSDE